MHLATLIVALLGAAVVMTWRVRESSRPITPRRLVVPPLGMSTGFLMFAFPPTRIPVAWGAAAFAFGAFVLSYPLVLTSKLQRDGDVIRMQRSKAFLWILVGLVAVRFALRAYVERYVSPLQTGSIFFVLAFGMILRWRATMYRDYRKLVASGAPRTLA